MTDVLIRGVPEEDLQRIDERAARLGLSRNEFMRRKIAQEAALEQARKRPLTHEDFVRFSELAADLKDEEVMRRAWS